MPKMGRTMQLTFPAWLDDWINDKTKRYGFSKSAIVRMYVQLGVLVFSICTQEKRVCPLLDLLLDKSIKDRERILNGTMTKNEIEVIMDEIQLETRLALRDRIPKMKKI